MEGSEGILRSKTVSPALFDAYFDLGLLTLIFAVVAIDSFWSYKISIFWVVFFILSSLFLAGTIYVLMKNLNKDTVENAQKSMSSRGGNDSQLRKVSFFS